MNFNLDYESIATAFIQHYYSKFDQGDGMARAQGLGDLYDPENSYMTFEGVQCKGRGAILEKFTRRCRRSQHCVVSGMAVLLHCSREIRSVMFMVATIDGLRKRCSCVDLTFKQIQRAITKCDSQPLYDGSILVMVLGQLKTDDDPINPFSQIFILRPNTTGSFFIGNEIFRLDLHNN
ncbi:putative nuclear transport factor 2 [Parelaphostrongylus tenuis]|uniref:Nuclear transport factor 2 n=1 Tax=Parelaphostrongylus tenuis TaxID=148309 RepID=A0AAD5ML45_PARTN|nr:putative nuclear transport factor 2 [Parelaphostrongylus tenuis]